MQTVIMTEIPDQLLQQAQNLVAHGWAGSLDTIVAESIRRYLESHQETMTTQFIREDLEWGLHGTE